MLLSANYLRRDLGHAPCWEEPTVSPPAGFSSHANRAQRSLKCVGVLGLDVKFLLWWINWMLEVTLVPPAFGLSPLWGSSITGDRQGYIQGVLNTVPCLLWL